MQESKIEVTDRLRGEGRWEEASKYKDDAVKRLRAEGMPAKEAREAAWCEMSKKYQASDAPQESFAVSDLKDLDAAQITALANAPLDYAGDVVWVYRHMENPHVALTDAPSLAAWGLLKYARGNKQRYYEVVLPKAIDSPSKSQATGKSVANDDVEDDLATNELSKFLSER